MFKPFEGSSGQRLGAPTASIISDNQPRQPASSTLTNNNVNFEEIKVDNNKPTTKIQVRTADGSR